MVLDPIRVECTVTLQREKVLVLLSLFLSLIKLSLLSIDGLRPGVELTEVVGVVCLSPFDPGNEILLVEAELQVTELMILRILIREFLWLDGLPGFRIDFIESSTGHGSLVVENGGHVELSHEPFTLFHHLPRRGLCILKCYGPREQ